MSKNVPFSASVWLTGHSDFMKRRTVVAGVTSQIGLWIPFGLSVLLVLAVVTLSQHAIKQT
jgi:hypothetical protein